MPLYSYQIGTTYGGLTNVESLATPLNAPKSTFTEYSQNIALGSGAVRGGGWAVATWNWGFLTQAQRNQLRTFCTGKSASIFIQTRKNDTSDAYQVYTAVMVWPDEEDKDHGIRLNFQVVFRNCVEYTP